MRERGCGLEFLVSSPRLRILVKSVLEYTEPVTPKRWASSSTIIKFYIYSRKRRGFRVESDSDYTTNLLTEFTGFNNTYRRFFIKT